MQGPAETGQNPTRSLCAKLSAHYSPQAASHFILPHGILSNVAPPPSQDEALSRYSASGEVPR